MVCQFFADWEYEERNMSGSLLPWITYGHHPYQIFQSRKVHHTREEDCRKNDSEFEIRIHKVEYKHSSSTILTSSHSLKRCQTFFVVQIDAS